MICLFQATKLFGYVLIVQIFFGGSVFASEFEKCQELYIHHLYLHKQINKTEISPKTEQLHQQLHEQQNEKTESVSKVIEHFHQDLHKSQHNVLNNDVSTYH